MFARFGVGRAVFMVAFEVLEPEPDGLQGETVGKVVGEHETYLFTAWVSTSRPVSALLQPAGTVM